MSWSFSFHGKVPAVRAAVEKLDQKFTIEGEQASYDSVKQTAIATLMCIDNSKHVFVAAAGSASTDSQYSKKTASATLSIGEGPYIAFGYHPGQYVE